MDQGRLQKMNDRKWHGFLGMSMTILIIYCALIFNFFDPSVVFHHHVQTSKCKIDQTFNSTEYPLYKPTGPTSCEIDDNYKNDASSTRGSVVYVLDFKRTWYGPPAQRVSVEVHNLVILNTTGKQHLIDSAFTLFQYKYGEEPGYELFPRRSMKGLIILPDLNCYPEDSQRKLYRCDPCKLDLQRLDFGFRTEINVYFPGNVDGDLVLNDSLDEVYSKGLGYQKLAFFMISLFLWIGLMKKCLTKSVMLNQQPCTPIEWMLLALGTSLVIMNCPMEDFQLNRWYPTPFYSEDSLHWRDSTKDIYYATLLSFMVVFVGEQIRNDDKQGFGKRYKRPITMIVFGCFLLCLFHANERFTNNWCEESRTIWNTLWDCQFSDLSPTLPLTVLALIFSFAGFYILYLANMIRKAFKSINEIKYLPISQPSDELAIINRLKVIMVATMVIAVLTVCDFMLGEIKKGRWFWNGIVMFDSLSSSFIYVHGFWNFYFLALLCLFKPSYINSSDKSGGSKIPDNKYLVEEKDGTYYF